MNNFADGMFIPDLMRTYNFSTAKEGYLVIESLDATMSLEMGINQSSSAHELNIKSDRLNITVNNGLGFVNIEGNLFVSGEITNPAPSMIVTLPVIPPFPP